MMDEIIQLSFGQLLSICFMLILWSLALYIIGVHHGKREQREEHEIEEFMDKIRKI